VGTGAEGSRARYHSRVSPRHAVIVSLVPPGIAPVIDVGADHGDVARALGAIATERHPHRRARPTGRWVIADGLRPFRRVGVAIVAGMGADRVLAIVDDGPPIDVLVAHADDDPDRLRLGLVARGWRIDAERLAVERGRFSEVVRAVRGVEAATGHALALGPRLLESADSLVPAWLAAQRDRLHAAMSPRRGTGPTGDARAVLLERLAFVEQALAARTSAL
jgi:tRNA A22 N-methylase